MTRDIITSIFGGPLWLDEIMPCVAIVRGHSGCFVLLDMLNGMERVRDGEDAWIRASFRNEIFRHWKPHINQAAVIDYTNERGFFGFSEGRFFFVGGERMMAISRWGKESDVYAYNSPAGFVCFACSLPEHASREAEELVVGTPGDMMDHLSAHRRAGHKVQQHAIDELGELLARLATE